MDRILLASKALITIVTALMIVVLTLGILFNRISWVDITISGVGIYTTLLILFLFGQFVLLAFIDRSSKEIRNVNSIIRSSRIAIWLSQILLSILVTTLLVEIVTVSMYHTDLLFAVNCIAYGISLIFTGLLTYKFFSWFSRQRNAVTIVYGIASLVILVNLLITLLFSITILSSRPDEVRQFLVSSGIFVQQDSLVAILNNAYQVSSVAMFIAMWWATAILLYYHSKRIGRIRFWILVAMPLVYFLSQFISSIQDIFMFLVPDPVLMGSILASVFAISLVAGGILFGIAFIKTSSKFSENDVIRNYLIVAGYGFMFFLISNTAVLLATVPYPPYAVQNVAFIGVASYSILVGIYSSAIAASNSAELRKSIRNFALEEGKLLDSIGTAEVQKMIEERASRMYVESQKHMEEEIGFTPLTKAEVTKHIEIVIKELEEAKARKGKGG